MLVLWLQLLCIIALACLSFFTASQTLIPMSDTPPVLNFTAVEGERVVLFCPIQPGALLEYYSVIWMKDNIKIADLEELETMNKTNSRYDIDRATYALIVDPVSVNDSSTSYECQVYVQNPNTGNKQQLHFYPQQTSGVVLSLTVKINNDSKFSQEGMHGSTNNRYSQLSCQK